MIKRAYYDFLVDELKTTLFRNTSLAVKLNILVLLVMILLLGGVGFLLVLNTRNLTAEIGGERIVEEVNIIQSRLAEIQKELIVDTNFIVTSVSFFQAVGRRDAQDTNNIITTANASLGLDDITIVDGDGKRLVDTVVDDDIRQEDAILAIALKGETTMALLIEENDGQIGVSLSTAAPIVSSTGNILGAIQMSRYINSEFLRGLIFGRKGIHLGLIYDGYFIARSVDNDSLARHILTNNIELERISVEKAQHGETIVYDELILGSGGVPHTLAYTPIPTDNIISPAVIMILVELDEIYSFQNSTLLNTILVFVALTAFAIAIIYIAIYRTTIRPLDMLRTISHTMTSGKYNERAPVLTSDEVGQLASAFNEMAIAVQLREDSLQDAREQAERANQVKSMFLASVSHELRTPLNAIINLTKFVGLGMYGTVNDEQIDILSKVEARSKDLLNLINDVLDISKIETGSLELFIEDGLQISDIVRSAIETTQSLILDKPVIMSQDIAEDLPSLRGDAQRIQQIVLNLLSNACKFTQEGEIHVRVYLEHEEIIISISDTGIGIQPDNSEIIFEAFRQTKEGLRKGDGTGLGLPISRRLAEAHEGRVWVESTFGIGSTFYIALPIETTLITTL